ncbi:MAG: energy transducer TonB [Muribaculaceae bacterium]|nr:energy transducer TonB [Muribaculaceae bacterium]
MKRLFLSLILSAVGFLSMMADSPASFPGGEEAMLQYFAENTKYPEAAREFGIEGVVNVECRILTDGKIGNIKITRMLDPDLEQEAIRLIKSMPAWTPAEKGGRPVEQTVTIPVKFTLPTE